MTTFLLLMALTIWFVGFVVQISCILNGYATSVRSGYDPLEELHRKNGISPSFSVLVWFILSLLWPITPALMQILIAFTKVLKWMQK